MKITSTLVHHRKTLVYQYNFPMCVNGCDHRNIEIDKKGVIAISHKAIQFLVKIIVF